MVVLLGMMEVAIARFDENLLLVAFCVRNSTAGSLQS
jgi:hypothetical protein